MQEITFSYPATRPPVTRTHVGVVASGDLEILVVPAPGTGAATITLRTSVDGFDTVWRRVLDRHFNGSALEAAYEINDFGATPGMVTLRLAQARELIDERGDQ